MVQANHLPSWRPSQFSPILKAVLRSQACITLSAVKHQSKLFPGLKCYLSLVAMVTHHVMCSYICDWFAVTFEAQDLLRFTAWLVFFFEWTVKTVFEALFYNVESVRKIDSFCGNLAWDKTTIVIARAVNETTTLYTVPENTLQPSLWRHVLKFIIVTKTLSTLFISTASIVIIIIIIGSIRVLVPWYSLLCIFLFLFHKNLRAFGNLLLFFFYFKH